MKKNMGNLDRIIRVVIAVTVGALFMTNIISGTLGIILLVAAGVFLLTSFVGLCPIYSMLRLSTRKKAQEPA